MSENIVSSVHIQKLDKTDLNEVKLYQLYLLTIISHATDGNLFYSVFIRFNDLNINDNCLTLFFFQQP